MDQGGPDASSIGYGSCLSIRNTDRFTSGHDLMGMIIQPSAAPVPRIGGAGIETPYLLQIRFLTTGRHGDGNPRRTALGKVSQAP